MAEECTAIVTHVYLECVEIAMGEIQEKEIIEWLDLEDIMRQWRLGIRGEEELWRITKKDRTLRRKGEGKEGEN